MKYLAFLLFSILLIGCSTDPIEMVSGSTLQKYDLRDGEGDGVINARDICLKTASGLQVDNSGCSSESVVKVRSELLVNFETNSYIVASNYLPEIERLADFMKEYVDVDVTIEGHTSIRGSKALNETLSQNRAQAIKDILVNRFEIEKTRLTAIGYGFSRLLLEGNDEYIHARNRRIVVEISSEKSISDQKWHIYSVDQRAEE